MPPVIKAVWEFMPGRGVGVRSVNSSLRNTVVEIYIQSTTGQPPSGTCLSPQKCGQDAFEGSVWDFVDQSI